jgi:hypothetical protein
MRCTELGETPEAFAMARRLQCVAAGGFVWSVRSTTLAIVSALSGFLPEGRVASRRRPSTPMSL